MSFGLLDNVTESRWSRQLLSTADSTTAMKFSLQGMFQYKIDRLQSVIRAAARLVLGLPKWASIPDAMHDKLHWLPFPERVEFKLCIASRVHKCLHESAPICLNTVYRSRRSLVDHTWDLRRPVTCLCQPPPPRQLLALVDFLCWSHSLELSPS